MGDRGNIVIECNDKRVYLYTHWRGSDIQEIARKALARKQRWDDPAYLARIVFCELIGGDVEGETGYGISTEICDNEHHLVVLNVNDRKVKIESETGHVLKEISFEGFVQLKSEQKEVV